MNVSERLYRFLLRAYPRTYRARYANPMEQLFRDRLREAHTLADLAALWIRTLADWTVSVPARYWELLTPHTHFGRLAYPARRCVFFARFEASSFSRREITVEHLLLGILREERALVPEAALPAIVAAIEANEAAPRRVPPAEDLRLTDAAIRVVATAGRIARRTGREVTPQDLAAAILREKKTLAARLLREHNPARSRA